MRAWSLLVLAGCWTGSPPQTPPEPARPAKQPEPVAAVAHPPYSCTSKITVSAAITSSVAQGRDVVLTLDVGTNQGLTLDWWLTDPSVCAIMHLDPTQAVAHCRARTPAQLPPRATVCAPTKPTPRLGAGGCPPGTAIPVPIIGTAIGLGKTIMTVGIGSAQGVDSTWRVTKPRWSCTIVRVEARTTVAECNATPDQIQADPNAVLCSP